MFEYFSTSALFEFLLTQFYERSESFEHVKKDLKLSTGEKSIHKLSLKIYKDFPQDPTMMSINISNTPKINIIITISIIDQSIQFRHITKRSRKCLKLNSSSTVFPLHSNPTSIPPLSPHLISAKKTTK